MEFDPVLLARLQFAFTITFHIIFPAFTIGLSAYIATLLVMWGMTGRDRYQRLARFWTRIFAVSFAMGVVSGIVLSYRSAPIGAGSPFSRAMCSAPSSAMKC
jgi:cytochrome d ubiquinol oxidase subunit I